MSSLYFDVIDSRTDKQLAALLDIGHDAVVEAFGKPCTDRYQIGHLNARSQMGSVSARARTASFLYKGSPAAASPCCPIRRRP